MKSKLIVIIVGAFGILVHSTTALIASELSSKTQAQIPQRPTLTAEQLGKINGVMSKAGKEVSLSSKVTQLLGLTKPGEVLVVHQLSGQDDDDTEGKIMHYFNRSKKNSNTIILMVRVKGGDIRDFLTDNNFVYRSGYVAPSRGEGYLLPAQEGESEMATEIRWWAEQMDTLKGNCDESDPQHVVCR